MKLTLNKETEDTVDKLEKLDGLLETITYKWGWGKKDNNRNEIKQPDMLISVTGGDWGLFHEDIVQEAVDKSEQLLYTVTQ